MRHSFLLYVGSSTTTTTITPSVIPFTQDLERFRCKQSYPYKYYYSHKYRIGQKTIHVNIRECTDQILACTGLYCQIPVVLVFSVKYRRVYANLNKISNFCTLIFFYFLKFKRYKRGILIRKSGTSRCSEKMVQ